MEEERRARLGRVVEAARGVGEQGRDGSVLQEFLRERGCDGVDAVFVTMGVVGCGLGEARRIYFAAPCRRDDLEFHNAFFERMERLEGEAGASGLPE
ncbi:hypothetical protein AB9128_03765 [Streptomyces cinereoruber]|uniref:hypothetical protein n=1 Tax=Streptomyces cinereoruber TaxID=67260 RepID=UPI003EB7F8C5